MMSCPVIVRRRRYSQVIKLFLCGLAVVLLVVCIQSMMVGNTTGPGVGEVITITRYTATVVRDNINSRHVSTTDSLSPGTASEHSHSLLVVGQHATRGTPSQPHGDYVSVQGLRDIVAEMNKMEVVLNSDKYPVLTSDNGLVIIVQVHRRLGYLRQFIESLRIAHEVEHILLVVSHDYYNTQINKLVQSITFCKVLQIFYPHSIQLYPDTFPGSSPNDCPKDISKKRAVQIGCTNAHHPDKYGHYREAKYTAVKHHWWWKINTVFDRLSITRNYSGHVIFVEEDHFLSPDFVYTARRLASRHKTMCPECDLISMGTYRHGKSYKGVSDKVKVEYFDSGVHNMAFGMDRQFWRQLKRCSKKFCTYDDYNWDWTLNWLSAYNCVNRKWKVLLVSAPRVAHIGTCGGLHKKAACNEARDADKARRHFTAQEQYLYPDSLVLEGSLVPRNRQRTMRPFGGWGDTRDHELCLSVVTQD